MMGKYKKPTVFSQVHMAGVDESNIKVRDSGGEETIGILFGGTSVYMTREQADNLFEKLEKHLYSETFEEIEDKYLSASYQLSELKRENEMLRERLLELEFGGHW